MVPSQVALHIGPSAGDSSPARPASVVSHVAWPVVWRLPVAAASVVVHGRLPSGPNPRVIKRGTHTAQGVPSRRPRNIHEARRLITVGSTALPADSPVRTHTVPQRWGLSRASSKNRNADPLRRHANSVTHAGSAARASALRLAELCVSVPATIVVPHAVWPDALARAKEKGRSPSLKGRVLSAAIFVVPHVMRPRPCHRGRVRDRSPTDRVVGR